MSRLAFPYTLKATLPVPFRFRSGIRPLLSLSGPTQTILPGLQAVSGSASVALGSSSLLQFVGLLLLA